MQSNANLEFRKIKSLNYLYEVNENGTIFRNVKSKKQLKIKLDFHHSEYGYYTTFVHLGGRKHSAIKRVMIHRVVAECWLGDCPDGYEVDHIDRDAHNNHYSNLRYVSHSDQMKNRDHSNISQTGSQNLENARRLRAKPVRIESEEEVKTFGSYADCSRYLSGRYNKSFEHIRFKLKNRRSRIYDYRVTYLRNAETGHGGSTEQGTVHESDLTGNYTTAFNEGKQQEVEMRVKHHNEKM